MKTESNHSHDESPIPQGHAVAAPQDVSEIAEAICGKASAELSPEESYRRMMVFALAGHYMTMALNTYASPLWTSANAGWSDTINAAKWAPVDVQALAAAVKDECNRRGLIAQSEHFQ